MANDINVVVVTGRVTRDAELKTIGSGSSCAKFSIAVNRKTKKGDSWVDEVSYFDCVLWGKSAETLTPYLKKGRQVSLDGELRQNRWEQDGQQRSRVEIYPEKVVLLGSGETSKPAGNSAPQTESQDDFAEQLKKDFNGSDVPFN